MGFEKANSTPALREEYRHSYDHAGRLLETTYRINDETEITLNSNQYDNLGRLTDAYGLYFLSNNSTLSFWDDSESFTYDKHGNISSLRRKWRSTIIDDLDFEQYNGNQIMKITDAAARQNSYLTKEYQDYNNEGNDFAYDDNGNMTKDFDRRIITIHYNLLNLPDTIQFLNGNQIVNRYDASGRKLASQYFTVHHTLNVPLAQGDILQLEHSPNMVSEYATFYADNKEYNYNGNTPGQYLLDKLYNTEGYASNIGSTGGTRYQYYRKDHLGNICEVWRANTNTRLQFTHYYPSGLPTPATTSSGAGVQQAVLLIRKTKVVFIF
jgi:hypothetical protein